MEFSSLVDLWLKKAESNTQAFYHYLRNAEDLESSISHAELTGKAKNLAGWLIAKGFSGERAMLVFPPGIEFVTAFMACVMAKVIAVPVAPAPLSGDKNKVRRIVSILRDCQPALVMGVSQTIEKAPLFTEENPEFNHITWFKLDEFADEHLYENSKPLAPELDDVAFLQYTSGSTSLPKGVMLSHRNILHNLDMWANGFGHDENSRIICWVPHFHDLGLLYGILTPLYEGISVYLLPAAAVVQKPTRWLNAISQFRGTHSMGPNFIYQHCVDRVTDEEAAGLDLSSWRMALNAAEPIRIETIEAFNNKFSPCGLDARTLTAGYGLAESTCYVTAQHWDAPIRSVALSAAALNRNQIALANAGEPASQIIACGYPEKDMIVKIVDPNTCVECAEGTVGEIWVSSQSASNGYWNRPQESLATFGARLVGDNNRIFMRTGDLGFFEQGDLFTTGRVKDLIIIRGENYYPQDAEWIIEQAHPAFKPSCCAVFSVEGDTEEKLVVVQELIRHWDRWDFEDMFAAVRRSVGAVYDLPIESIVFIRPGTTAKTSSGKIQRGASKKAFLADGLQVITRWDRHAPVKPIEVPATTSLDIENFLISRIADVAALALSSIDPVRPFADYGLGSVDSTILADELVKQFNLQVSPTAFYDFPSIRQLARALTKSPDEVNESKQNGQSVDEDMIVVVGMACRFPGANTVSDYWQIIRDGSVTTSTKTTADGQLRYGGFLENAASFDNDFFAITNREASCLDPQQRMALEISWQALEDAGVIPSELAESATGVFFGASSFDYGSLQFSQGTLDSYSCQGSVLAVIANRIAYHFDFRGPSFVVDTACSSALTSLHLACRSLRDKECNMALAGAVNLIAAEDWDSALKKAGMLSPDGACKTFDASANGYVRGEGCGVLVLKRYADAVRDGDRIYGSILGTAINQDGRSNGLTAPNGNAQEALLKNVLNFAKIAPEELGYIEAHGTGTPLGDPIECRALARVLGQRPTPCIVGSVKGNIGHLEAAAGMAGVIKTLLAVHHGVIPPQANFKQLNPLIELGSQLAISLEAKEWAISQGKPRVASVSAFGFSGSNACALIGSVPQPVVDEYSSSTPEVLPFVLSAQDLPALKRMANRYADFLTTLPEQKWSEFIYTAATHRETLATRFFNSAAQPHELIKVLRSLAQSENPISAANSRGSIKIALAFSEFEQLRTGFAESLYKKSVHFRDALNECDSLLERLTGTNLLNVLYGQSTDVEISDARVIYPVTFSLQYALVKTLSAFGVSANVVVGYGIGDYAALVAAGSISLDTAMKLIVARSEVAYSLSPGSTRLDVYSDEKTLLAAIEQSRLPVVLIAVISNQHCVVSGSDEAIKQFADYTHSELTENPKMPASPAKTALPIPVDPNAQLEKRQMVETLLRRLLHAQLSSLGLFKPETVGVNEWKKAINFPSLYDAWLEQSLYLLEAAGYITNTHGKLQSVLTDTDPWHEWEQQKLLWVNDPQMRSQIVLVDTVLKALPSILNATRPATSVMFPNGSFHLVEGIYKNTALSDYYNAVLAEGLIAYIEETARKNPTKKIRIIEIGAGTGGTSALLFDKLAAYQHQIEEYCYTDISSAFLLHARENFLQKAPYLVTRLFNIEADLPSQEMASGTYDVLVATNVLHATKDMRNTLRHCKALLKQDGRLLINEISDFNLFTHLTFGMLEGWWLYTDQDIRVKGCPALSSESWKNILHQEGFAHVQLPAQDAHILGQQVIAAQSDGISRLSPSNVLTNSAACANSLEPLKDSVAVFSELANSQNYFAPTKTFVSQINGRALATGTRLDGNYFVSQLHTAAHYGSSFVALEQEQVSVVLEIGSTTNKTIVQQSCPELLSRWQLVCGDSGDSWTYLLDALGRIFTEGGDINWKPVFGSDSLPIMSLPPYAFETKMHWFQRDETKFIRQQQDNPVLDIVSNEQSVDEESEDASISDKLTEILARLIYVAPEKVDREQSFFEMGVDSISLMEFASVVSTTYSIQLGVSEIFEEYPCINLVSKKLEDVLHAEEMVS